MTQASRTIDSRTGYEFKDANGTQLATVVEVGDSDLTKLAHPGASRKLSSAGVPDWLAKRFEVRSPDGAVLLELTRIRQAKKTLVVALPGGTEVGRIRQENLIGGKPHLAFEVGEAKLGEITQEGGWLRRGAQRGVQRFTATVTAAGNEAIARFTMKRLGNVHFEVNEYDVEILGSLDDQLQTLTVVSAVAIDQALFEGE